MASVYFGNANKQTWIKAPSTGMQAGASGFISEAQLLDGSTYVKKSKGSHRRFDMSWLGNLNDTSLSESLQTIKDFCDGVYGNGPFFWNDPYAVKSNLFSPSWATPSLSIDGDWPDICPDDAPVTKEKVTTASISSLVGANTQDYPTYAAKFTAAGGDNAESNKFTLYIPDGYTLWLGLHGHHGSTGAAFAKPYSSAGVAGTPVSLTPLGVNTTTRVNTSFSSTTAKKVEFYLAKTGTTPCTFHIVGVIAQLLPTGTSPAVGGFLTGRGTTGLDFATFPQIEYYSANINNGQIGMSATLVEV